MDLSTIITTRYLTISREIDVLNMETFVPDLEEVFISLPKINRFNGQTIRPYSVAIHSYMCIDVAISEYGITQPHLLLAILLHDAAEAYIGDIVRPIKINFNGKLSEIENTITEKIFNLVEFTELELEYIHDSEFIELVKEIDSRMALTEAKQLRLGKHEIKIGEFKPFNIALPITDWPYEEELLRKSYEYWNEQRLAL